MARSADPRGRAEAVGAALPRQPDVTTFLPSGPRAWPVRWALVPARVAGDVPVAPAECSGCGVTAACVGNIDDDPEVDVWSISTERRVSQDGEEIAAGVPWHDRIDRESAKPERRGASW